MAGSLRRLIEDLAVVKPGRKTSRSMTDAAKAALAWTCRSPTSWTTRWDRPLKEPAPGLLRP